MSDFLSRDALLKRRARRTKVVTISKDHPEPDLAGKKITVRSMTARERGEWESQFSDKTGKTRLSRTVEIRERLVIATVIDETGNALFTEDDLAALKEVDAAILEAIVKASQELNDISSDDLAALEKNSVTTPSAGPRSK